MKIREEKCFACRNKMLELRKNVKKKDFFVVFIRIVVDDEKIFSTKKFKKKLFGIGRTSKQI